MIPLEFHAAVNAVKKSKEGAVARAVAGENDELTPIVEGYRDGQHVVTVMAPNVDRDEGLYAYRACVAGLRLDHAWIMTDAHISTSMNSPSGEPWKPGQMQHLCDSEDACSTGLITDTLVICGRYRSAREYMINSMYHIHKTARKVVWIASDHEFVDSETGEGGMEGYVIDQMREAFELPSVLDEVEKVFALGEDDPKPARMEAIAAAALYNHLMEQGYVVMPSLDPNDPDFDIYQQYLLIKN